MKEIFRKTVEKPETDGGRFKLSSSDFPKLPEKKFKVRDNKGNKWDCYRKEGCYLHVEKWNDFVKKLGIEAGRSQISLLEFEENENDPFSRKYPSSPEEPSYKFEVEN
ncbi:hypothetical protein SLE2022_040270 [Rubroshorea leprosula]